MYSRITHMHEIFTGDLQKIIYAFCPRLVSTLELFNVVVECSCNLSKTLRKEASHPIGDIFLFKSGEMFCK